jgi:DNA adenine methylase
MLPADHTCYCEPFCGACWILFAKEPSKVEVINDADSELITFWRVVQNHLPELQRYYTHAVTSREIFDLHKRTDPQNLTDVQRAVRYFYLQKLAFGGKTSGRTFGTSPTRSTSINLLSMEEDLLNIHWRMSRVVIENLDAVDCIKRYDRPGTLFYCDPPYHKTAGYAVDFGEPDLIRLAETLGAIKGRFLVSLNDHPDVRRIFEDFKIASVHVKYSAGKSTASRAEDRKEVVIRNFG